MHMLTPTAYTFAFVERLTKAEQALQLFQYIRIVKRVCACHGPSCLTLSIIWKTLLLNTKLKVKVLITPGLVQVADRNENDLLT